MSEVEKPAVDGQWRLLDLSTIASVLLLEHLETPNLGEDPVSLWTKLMELVVHVTGIPKIPSEILPVFSSFLRNEILNQHPEIRGLNLEIMSENKDSQEILRLISLELRLEGDNRLLMRTVPREQMRKVVSEFETSGMLSPERARALLAQLK